MTHIGILLKTNSDSVALVWELGFWIPNKFLGDFYVANTWKKVI